MKKPYPSRTPEYIRALMLRVRYGMTVEKYNEMFAEQKGCCLICERHQSEFVNRLAVDHNHDNNAIRGLLCHHCNTALSRFEDNPERLRKAAEYLETRPLV